MVIQVPTDVAESIRQKVERGLYDDPEAAIRMALRLLDKRDQRLEELRASIAEGIAAIERGEGKELTPELMEQISQEASRRARLGMAPKPDVCP